MRNLALLALSTMFGVILGNLEMCYARTKCTPARTSDEPYLVRGSCSIQSYYFLTQENLENHISNYASYQNVMIFGVQASNATKLLESLGILGNKAAVWYNQLISIRVYTAVEIVSQAVKLAIEDFCLENHFVENYEFV